MQYLYMKYDYDVAVPSGLNKLFCTFSEPVYLGVVADKIKEKYNVLYDKIFVLESKDNEELILTYNLDFNNVSAILPNTISVHRKKETKTLYTINALNEYILLHNDGKPSKNFNVDWKSLKNSIMLTQQGELKVLKTKINQVILTS